MEKTYIRITNTFSLHNNNCCMILTNFKRSRAFKGRRFDQRDETGREHSKQ